MLKYQDVNKIVHSNEKIRELNIDGYWLLQILACFCWALKNIERSVLRQWIRDLSSTRILQFLDVLQLAVSCFEFKSMLFCSSQVTVCAQTHFGKAIN